MIKAKQVNKAINWIAGAAAVYFVGTAIAGAIKRKRTQGAQGVGATNRGKKKFYVYAGYYENYISSKPMPAPYVFRGVFGSIDSAIDYAESFGDTVIFCDNVKNDLPDYIYDALQEEDYFSIGKINPNRNGTRVIFRTFTDTYDRGEVIALFPDEKWDMGFWETASYMHVGQHGGANYNHIISVTRPSTPQEYAPLLRELQEIGYDDLIIA